MIYRDLEIYNVTELLEGDGAAVVPPSSIPTLSDWHVSDVEYLAADGQGAWFSRIPNDLRLSLNALALVNAVQAAGAELRFNLKSPEAVFTLKCNQQPSICEIWQGSFFVGWRLVGTEATKIGVQLPANIETLVALSEQHNLPFDARLTRVLLPWRPPARLIDLEGEWEPPRSEQVPKQRFLAYGSSITHGATTIGPSSGWAPRTAQILGVDLINLGFGGGAHLEPQMADYIAGRDDWDFATLETGINIGGVGRAEFARRVDYFVETVARAHPDKWIFCLGVFNCRPDLLKEPVFAEYRAEVKAKVESLGLPKLVYLDGLELGPSLAGLATDLVHPSPAGMEEIAHNLVAAIHPHLASNGAFFARPPLQDTQKKLGKSKGFIRTSKT